MEQLEETILKINGKINFNIDNDEHHYSGTIDIIKRLAEENARFIDNKIREFGITEKNAKDYYININKTNKGYNCKIYKTEKIGEFIF